VGAPAQVAEPVPAVQPVVQAPLPQVATQMPLAPAAEPPPPKPAHAAKSAKTPEHAKVTQAAKETQPLPGPPAEHTLPVQVTRAQTIPELIEARQGFPAAQPEPAAVLDRTTKKTKKIDPTKLSRSVDVAVLGPPNLKAMLPADTAEPSEAPRAPPRLDSSAACNGGRRVMSAYYWEGSHTASGQPFNPHAMTAAHRTLPFGTRLNVTNPRTGKTVSVLINDRGPFVRGVSLDLSLGAAQAIGLHGTGSVCIL